MKKLFGKETICVMMYRLKDHDKSFMRAIAKGIPCYKGYAIVDIGIIQYNINNLLAKYFRAFSPYNPV